MDARRIARSPPHRRGGFEFGPVQLSMALFVGACYSLPLAGPAAVTTNGLRVDYFVVVTGGEILHGAFADGHTHFLTRTLLPMGLHCVGSMTVDDRPEDIKAALAYATNHSQLVIVTGGLGPTENDVSRTALREFTGIPVKEHPEVLRELSRRFQQPAEQLRANLRRQTQVPTRGTYLNNANGTAVGLVFEMERAVVVALPGPPRELQTMVRDELVPYLSRRYGTRPPGSSLTVRFVGLGQSQIDQTLKERVPIERDIIQGSAFAGGRVDFTFSLRDDTPADRVRLEKLREKMQGVFGDSLYATDAETTLEQVVAAALRQRGETLALVELASGGSLAASFSSAPDAAHVLAGDYVASSAERLQRLLPATAARPTLATNATRQLADRVAEVTGSHWVIVVGEPPPLSGRGLVEVCVRKPDGRMDVQPFNLRWGASEATRAAFATQVWDRLRRQLSELRRVQAGSTPAATR